MNRIKQTPSDGLNRINALFARCCRWSKYAALSLVLLAALPLSAQTVQFIGPRVRATMPVGVTSSLIMSNIMSFGTNGLLPDLDNNTILQPINIDVTGLPSGVTYSITNVVGLTNYSGTPLRTNLGNSSVPLWITLNHDGTTAEGTYTFSVNASGGANNHLNYTLDVAHIWTGTTNALRDGAGPWSSSTNWGTTGTLGTNVDSVVVFMDWGGQTNYVYSNSTPPGVLFTNYLISSIVDNDCTISSIRFAQTNAGYVAHNIQINPGKTLKITGDNGFSMLRDFDDLKAGIGANANVTFIGTNGAALVVTNPVANFSLLMDNGVKNTLDMSQLDNFQATVNRFNVGDAEGYPNFWNMDTNNYGNHLQTGDPAKMIAWLAMARTNLIKAYYVGPDNYTDSATRRYGVIWGRTVYGGGVTVQNQWYLGITNAFFADGICIGGSGLGYNSAFAVRFNPIFANSNAVAVFRGTNGGRMPVFAVADNATGPWPSRGSAKINVDFGANRGTVDALVDRVIVAADYKLIENGQNPTSQGQLAMGAGIFDANTVYLGYQTSGVHTNSATSQNYQGYCTAFLSVSNTAVFKINDSLVLGYTTETPSATGPQTTLNRGQVCVTNGGTMMVNRVLVGGVTKGSGNNSITIASAGTNVSTFILSNTIAASDMYLAQLTMSGGAVLQVHVDGSLSAPYIYVTNNAIAAGNFIRIGSLNNVTYVGGVAQLPLISYWSGTPTIPGVIMPAGFTGSGSIVPDGASAPFGWNLYVSTNPPNTNLLWRAPFGLTGTTNWDTSSKVWFDRVTGLMTNFHNGDWVEFDDTPGYATNIAQTVSILLPGQVIMSNTVVPFKFTGSGVQGGGVLTKRGTGALEIGGTFAIPITITQGLLTNNSSGSIVGVSVDTGASLANAGTINGNISCGGQCYNLGIISGAMAVTSGGVVTNLNYLWHGAFTLATNTLLYNGVSAIMDDYGASTVASNATLINDGFLGVNGSIYSQTITVSGTLKDTGASGSPTMSLLTLTINPGALFIPGGDGIGMSTIRNPQGITTGNPGRVLLSSGSTNIFKVDPAVPTNTLLRAYCQDFGPSQSSQLQNGCTLVITNVNPGSPFAAGQYFRMFRKNNGDPVTPTGTATNSFPIIVPATPGPGLIWDLRYLWGDKNYNVDPDHPDRGYIGVMVPPVVSLTNSFSLLDVTNIVGQFSWPSTNFGWRLQTLVTPNTVGLSGDTNYNWTSVAGSWTNTTLTLTNVVIPNTNVFFRLVYP
jgi:hypothetical protein